MNEFQSVKQANEARDLRTLDRKARGRPTETESRKSVARRGRNCAMQHRPADGGF